MSYPWQRDRSDATSQEPEISEHDPSQPGAVDQVDPDASGSDAPESDAPISGDPQSAETLQPASDQSSTPDRPVEGSFLGSLAAAHETPPEARPEDAQEAPQDAPQDFPPHTGDPAVDAALAGAAAAQTGDPAEQLETYVGTHRALQERLADSGA